MRHSYNFDGIIKAQCSAYSTALSPSRFNAHTHTQAVEYKQVAQQEAERARFLVEQAEQEKQANIIRAEGDNEVGVMCCAVRNISSAI